MYQFEKHNLCGLQKVDEMGRYDAYCIRTKGHDPDLHPHEYEAGYVLEKSLREDKLLLKFTISQYSIDNLVYREDEDWTKANTMGPFVNPEDAKAWLINNSVTERFREYAHPLLYTRKRVVTSENENGFITVEVYV